MFYFIGCPFCENEHRLLRATPGSEIEYETENLKLKRNNIIRFWLYATVIEFKGDCHPKIAAALLGVIFTYPSPMQSNGMSRIKSKLKLKRGRTKSQPRG